MNRRLIGALVVSFFISTSIFAQDDDQVIAYRLFVGTADGAHESHDWGENWFSIAANLPGTIRAFACLGPEAFAVGGQGIYFSEKFGETWVRLESWTGGGATAVAVSSYFAIDPVMFVGTARGLFVSRDGGDHWGPVGRAVVSGAVSDIAWPGAVLFVTTDNGLFGSRDGGNTWKAAGEGLPEGPLLSVVASRYFDRDPVAFVGSDGEGLYRSRDGGETFEKLRFPGRRVYDLYWWRASLFAGSDVGPLVSTDAGESWELLTEDLEDVPIYAIHIPAPDSPSGGDIILGTDRGAFKSSDGGMSWRSMTRGLGKTRVFGFGNFPISSSDPTELLKK
jgi:photosystem II stability/assembly factor-like uncharacterized protein